MISSIAQRLIDSLAGDRPLAVAFSGGVDSSVVAAAAMRARVPAAIAVTADSPSVPRRQIAIARDVAGQIGIEHRIIATGEVRLPAYRRNDGQRCFHCKSTLYDTLRVTLSELATGGERFRIVSGTNADDLGDHRPGIEAGRMAEVLTPLADSHLTKSQVRSLATFFDLSNAELAASPCLASRVAYGVEVTPRRLAMVEAAEAELSDRGFGPVRVRVHTDDLARIEVPVEQIASLTEPTTMRGVDVAFRKFGFRYVTIDVRGFRSGSLNDVLVTIDPPTAERS